MASRKIKSLKPELGRGARAHREHRASKTRKPTHKLKRAYRQKCAEKYNRSKIKSSIKKFYTKLYI